MNEWYFNFAAFKSADKSRHVRFQPLMMNQWIMIIYHNDNLSQCVPKFLFQQVSTFWVPNRGFLFPARFVVFSFQSVTYMLKQPFHFENLFCFSGSSGPPVTANLILFNCGRTRIKIINADCNILRLSSLQSRSLNRL